MPTKPKTKPAPLTEELTPLTPEAAALVETWLTASRASKAAADIKKNLEASMLSLIQQHKLIKLPAAVIALGESVSYDYPAEIAALESLCAALKKEAKADGTAKRESKDVVTVEDFQQAVNPEAATQPAALHGLKAWLSSLFKPAA